MKSKILTIIPARYGSKRILHKNIRNFLGKPIIQYAITFLKEFNNLGDINVLTDNKLISDIARNAGAKIPYLRLKKTSTDIATLSAVILEAINYFEGNKLFFDYVYCILPTSVMIQKKYFLQAMEMIQEKKYDSLVTICKYSHPIQRALEIKENKISMINHHNEMKPTQSFSECYYDAGQFYLININKFKKIKRIFMPNTMGIQIPELYSQDIDNYEDWKYAEIKYQILNKLKK